MKQKTKALSMLIVLTLVVGPLTALGVAAFAKMGISYIDTD